MKSLVLSLAIFALASGVRFDEWYFAIPALTVGVLLLNLYHSEWFKNRMREGDYG
jgi:hypothetical protein